MIVEFRIPLPIQVSDFEIAQLFMITKLQENVTGGGEGVIILKNEPFYFGMSVNPRFDNTDGHMGISPVSGITVPKAKGQYFKALSSRIYVSLSCQGCTSQRCIVFS